MQSQVNFTDTGKCCKELAIQPTVPGAWKVFSEKQSLNRVKFTNNENAFIFLLVCYQFVPKMIYQNIQKKMFYCHLPWKLLLIPEGKVFPSITTVGSMMISRLRPCDPVTSRWPPPPSSFSIISLSCRSRMTSCHSPLSRR